MIRKNPTVKQKVWDFVEQWPVYSKDTTDPLLYLDDEERLALQNKLLIRQMAWVAEGSRYYRDKFKEWGIEPGDIRSVDDLEKIPLTTKQDYMAKPEDFILRFREPNIYDNLWQVTYTTGTTMGKPTPFYSTSYDYYSKLLQFRRRCKAMWITPEDVQVSIMPLGSLPHLAYFGLLDNGPALTCPTIMTCVGSPHPEFDVHNTMDHAIETIEKFRAVVIYSLTSYARRLLMRAMEQGRDFSPVRIIVVAGEPCTRGLRDDIRGRFEALGAKDVFITNGFACTEINSTMPECREFSGSHNTSPDLIYLEVVAGDGKRVPEGQQGLLALTHLNRRGTVLLRYLTGDLVTMASGPCPHCGRPGQRLVPTEGSAYAVRTSDLIKVKGTLINPVILFEIMAGTPDIEEYQIRVEKEDPADQYSPDQMVIRVAAPGAGRDELAAAIVARVKNACEIRPRVEFVEAGKIYDATASGKAVRLVDARKRPD